MALPTHITATIMEKAEKNQSFNVLTSILCVEQRAHASAIKGSWERWAYIGQTAAERRQFGTIPSNTNNRKKNTLDFTDKMGADWVVYTVLPYSI